MQSVLISIRPQWCKLIASGKKTIEVRKTRPKLDTPFKCYIYRCLEKYGDIYTTSGKVIGDFMCDQIKKHSYDDFIGAVNADGSERTEAIQGEGTYWFWENERKKTCLSQDEIFKYGGTKPLYAWHISALRIYDKPKELSKFVSGSSRLEFGTDGESWVWSGMTRPPMSWCYVEIAE